MGAWFKYAGLPFPGGGHVLVGNTYRDFRKRYFGVFELLVEGMNVGADGYYLLVDRADGTIVSGFRGEWAGCPLADSGIDPQTFGDHETVRTAPVFGVRSYVRRAGGTEQADDITLLAFRRVGSYRGIIAENGIQQERLRHAETL